jgi:hypothetical protein
MNIISTFLLPFVAIALALTQGSSQVGQSNEQPPLSIKNLRNVPTEIVVEGRSLSLSTYPWRDFMPTTFPAPNGSPLMVVLKVASSDNKPLPSGMRLERAWVLFGEEMWEASDFRSGRRPVKDGWIICAETPVCEATIRGGPKWGPGVFVDVVVRLIDKEGRHHLLRAPKQLILRSD